jgi:hypothetical protein
VVFAGNSAAPRHDRGDGGHPTRERGRPCFAEPRSAAYALRGRGEAAVLAVVVSDVSGLSHLSHVFSLLARLRGNDLKSSEK